MSKYNVLIIEDDPHIAASLSEMLEILDHKVVGVAPSYEEAIEKLKDNDVEIALVDIQLKSEKTGIDVADKLKTNSNYPLYSQLLTQIKKPFRKLRSIALMAIS